jgi:hypothetical protein
VLNLDCANLRAYPSTVKIYEQLARYPLEMLLYVMDVVVTQFFEELARVHAADQPYRPVVFKVRPFNMATAVNLRDLNPDGAWNLSSWIRGFLN